ncbi:MAG TPA: hypothetical protein VEI01_26080 [Terriglobales bacterium]|nr:hypothetical protein [Terriglobales bacterium]
MHVIIEQHRDVWRVAYGEFKELARTGGSADGVQGLVELQRQQFCMKPAAASD